MSSGGHFASTEWMLPETKEMLERQEKRKKNVLEGFLTSIPNRTVPYLSAQFGHYVHHLWSSSFLFGHILYHYVLSEHVKFNLSSIHYHMSHNKSSLVLVLFGVTAFNSKLRAKLLF